ncbi:MAG: hypothetical protein ABIV50_00370 [Opitutus sp.]
MIPFRLLLCTVVFGPVVLPASVPAATENAASRNATVDAQDLATFERKATLAKRLGATHVPITDGLPTARWQFQPADDPYPAWYIQRPDFLKLYPPTEVQPHVDMEYGRRIASLLEERCKILRRLGLKAHWGSNLPQVLPESFFTAYPQLRGPRVDQPNRSKTARFSMCVDQPETVRLYTEAIKTLLTRCPEIESMSFLTQDSGSGFCWVPALYPGLNGHSDCKDRPMADRISSFLVALKDAAKQSGHDVEISLNPITPRQWMIPSFSPEQLDAIVHQLPRGVAVQGREGPDGRAYQRLGTSDAYARGAFYPIVGLTLPDVRWLRTGRAPEPRAQTAISDSTPARRLISLRADESVMEFNARVADATKAAARGNVAERLTALRSFAVAEVTEAQADNLLETWLLLDDVERRLEGLDFGDMLQFGHVLNRWINRPMVPFPEELSADEKSYYRPFLFQAKGEEQAENLADIQAMRMYEGYGARLLFQQIMDAVTTSTKGAMKRAQQIRDAAAEGAARTRWDLFCRRLEAATCLMRSAEHMVMYQAQLDRVKALGIKPEPDPVLGVQSSWDRTDLMETARKEIDNTVHLKRLLETTSDPILDLAANPEEETIMRLGPDMVGQLKRKIDLMNAHWMDYDRLFTAPNP